MKASIKGEQSPTPKTSSPEYFDKKGIPICENDLIRVFHFKSRKHNRNRYLYKIAKFENGLLSLIDLDDVILKKAKPHSWTAIRGGELSSCEIIDGYAGDRYFTERKRASKTKDKTNSTHLEFAKNQEEEEDLCKA